MPAMKICKCNVFLIYFFIVFSFIDTIFGNNPVFDNKLHKSFRRKLSLRLRGGAETVEEGKLTYSLRDLQKAALEELIARVIPDNATACGPWKTLLFDDHWRDVFTMAIKPSELRLHGVVCHQTLEEPMEELPEFPAAYFINCEETNVTLLADDVNADRFESIYLYASGPTPMDKWDGFLARVDPELFVSRVRTVSDIFADFICRGLSLHIHLIESD